MSEKLEASGDTPTSSVAVGVRSCNVMEQTYRKRLSVAAWEDFSKFWSAHRYWVTVVSLFISPLIVQVLRSGLSSLLSVRNILESAAIGIGLSVVGNAIIAFWRGAKTLDAGLQTEVKNREALLVERDRIIEQRDEKIRSITAIPRRTPADRHHYDTAKKTIDQLGPSCGVALRYLKTHMRFVIGTFGSPLPPGIPRDDLIRIFTACLDAGLVTARDNPSQGERTFEIAPTMNAVLDELLYENGGSTD